MSVVGWSSAGYAAVIGRVTERTGLCFAPALRPSVEAIIRREMARKSIRQPAEYLTALDDDDSAFEALASALTIGETYFFREPAQLEYLRTHAIPELARERRPGEPLRAWSAGCAGGEEAYTLAILLRELGLAGSSTVLGTDLSPERIARAREGSYSRWSLRGVPEAVEAKYFRQRGNRYQVVSEIRAAVRFHPLNLAGSAYPSAASGIFAMDLILCRNVLIYLDAATVAGVAERLMASLSDRGWLLLGASDPPLADLVPCEVVVTGAGIAYRRPAARPANGRAPLERVKPVARVGETRTAPPPRRDPVAVARRDTPDAAVAAARYAARDYAGAAEAATRCVERDGSEPALWTLLVRSLANRGMLEEAERTCVRAVRRHPTSAELLYLHGVVLAAAERHAEAAAAARRALYLDRGLVVAHLLLGDAMRRLGRGEEAKRALRNAQRMLASLPAAAVVPASDAETAGRLLELARIKLRLAEGAA